VPQYCLLEVSLFALSSHRSTDFHEDKKQILVPSGCAHGFFCLHEATITYSQGGTFDASQEQVKKSKSLFNF